MQGALFEYNDRVKQRARGIETTPFVDALQGRVFMIPEGSPQLMQTAKEIAQPDGPACYFSSRSRQAGVDGDCY